MVLPSSQRSWLHVLEKAPLWWGGRGVRVRVDVSVRAGLCFQVYTLRVLKKKSKEREKKRNELGLGRELAAAVGHAPVEVDLGLDAAAAGVPAVAVQVVRVGQGAVVAGAGVAPPQERRLRCRPGRGGGQGGQAEEQGDIGQHGQGCGGGFHGVDISSITVDFHPEEPGDIYIYS